MAGLDPATHGFVYTGQVMGTRAEPGHDTADGNESVLWTARISESGTADPD